MTLNRWDFLVHSKGMEADSSSKGRDFSLLHFTQCLMTHLLTTEAVSLIQYAFLSVCSCVAVCVCFFACVRARSIPGGSTGLNLSEPASP